MMERPNIQPAKVRQANSASRAFKTRLEGSGACGLKMKYKANRGTK